MDAVRAQAPVLRNWRRNVAVTIALLGIATMMLCVNQNVTLPFTDWNVELRVRLHRTPAPLLQHIGDLFDAYPMRGKLYSIFVLCSPRLGILWTWLFDYHNTIHLLHEQLNVSQGAVFEYLRPLASAVLPDVLPDVLPPGSLESSSAGWLATTLRGLLLQVQQRTWFWLAWAMCPGLQAAYYAMLFVKTSPIKVLYAVAIGAARTGVEVSVFLRCLMALLQGRRDAVLRCLLCCYLLPLVMTFQSITVLSWMCMMTPGWVVHISMVAFCLWGPPVMIAIMTTAHHPANLRDVPAEGAAENGQQPAAAGAANGNNGAAGGGILSCLKKPAGGPSVHWPPPVEVPPGLEDSEEVPRSFLCPITHALMRQPAVTVTGASYERGAIEEWLRTRKRDPLTGRELSAEQLSPNLNLFSAIEEWVASKAAAVGS